MRQDSLFPGITNPFGWYPSDGMELRETWTHRK